jgi:hypothetical protein
VTGLASPKQQQTARGCDAAVSPSPNRPRTPRERLALSSTAQGVGRKRTGQVCIVCGTSIEPSEVENEVVGPITVWSHLPCYSIWREESQTHETAGGAVVGTDGLASLRQIVRDRFANGTLSVLPHDKSWTGRGVSDLCGVCSNPIFAAESSQEVIGAPRAHAHLVCYRAWLLESIASRQLDERSSAEPPDDASG